MESTNIKTWQDVWQLPFSTDGVYITSKNHRKAAMFLTALEISTKVKFVDMLNGNGEKAEGSFTLRNSIYIDHNNKPFLLMRGWGYLTGTGGLNLPFEKAIELQNDLVNYILKISK